MNKKEINFDYKRLHPFKWYILENFPFLEDSIDALTNYQLFCKLGEMYNKEIDAINMLGVQVEGITDWFDNLDLQEEVNNKLDEMASSGELEEIIGAYINTNAILGFNTVSDLKIAENLVDGSYAQTLGFYNKNDGGSALYKIRNITNDDVINEMNIIELADDNLIAELITIGIYNVNQLGIIPNENDNINKLNSLLQTGSNKTYYIPSGTYLVSDTINCNSNNNIIMDSNTIIKATETIDNLFIYNSTRPNGIAINNYIIGGIFDGDYKVKNGIQLGNYANLRFENVQIYNVKEKGLICKHEYSTMQNDLLCKNVYIRNWENVYSGSIGIVANCTDSSFYDGNIIDFETAIECSSNNSFYNVHPWIHYTSIYENSYFCKFTGNAYALFESCISDSYRTIFQITGSSLHVNNMRIFNSPTYITQNIQTQYPMIFINNTTGSGIVNCTNVNAYTEWGDNNICTKYDNRNIFYNCHFTSNNGTWNAENYIDLSSASYQLGEINTTNNRDFNTLTDTKIYRMLTLTTATNNPTTNSGVLEVIKTGASFKNNVTIIQRYTELQSKITYKRTYTGTQWTAWVQEPLVIDANITNTASATVNLNSSYKIANLLFLSIDFTLTENVDQFGELLDTHSTIPSNTRIMAFKVGDSSNKQMQLYTTGKLVTNNALSSGDRIIINAIIKIS